MSDLTETFRRIEVEKVNGEVESNDPLTERKRLEVKYGQVWDTAQLGDDFTVQGFLAPFITATRKSDGKICVLEFQHYPRFYFSCTLDLI